MKQLNEENRCESPGCFRHAARCADCGQSFCWQHVREAACVTCRESYVADSFEKRTSRLVGIGFSALLGGLLLLLLPRDDMGIDLQLAIALFVIGCLLLWLGLLARM